MENDDAYRRRDILYAHFKIPFLNKKEKEALRKRAGPLDDTWTLTEQLASERYQQIIAGKMYTLTDKATGFLEWCSDLVMFMPSINRAIEPPTKYIEQARIDRLIKKTQRQLRQEK